MDRITCGLGDLRFADPTVSEKQRIMYFVGKELLPKLATTAKSIPSGTVYVDNHPYYYCKSDSRYKPVLIRDKVTKAEAHAQYKKDNPEKTAANRIRHNGLTPFLTDTDKAILLRYREKITLMNDDTGILHHLDHIRPRALGGAHLPINWQILPEEENLKKGDRLDFSFKGLMLINDQWIIRPDEYRGAFIVEEPRNLFQW